MNGGAWRRRSAHALLFGLLLLAGLVAMAPGRAASGLLPQATPTASPEQLVRGHALYEERCASCHGTDATGTDQGPTIVGLGAAFYDFMMSTGRMPLDRPVAQAPRRPPVLSQEEIDAITAYLSSLPPRGGTPIPNVDADAGNLSRGQHVYQLNCAACHGTSGNGGSVGPFVAPQLHESTPTQVGEAVRIGPGNMPVFDPTTISDDDLNSLARYVQYLRDPEDRGGSGLSHIGPLVEGFVALLVGLGALVIVTRYTGERA